MVGFKELVGKFIMVALIVLPLMSFIAITQSDNSAPQSMTDNNIFNESFGGLIDTIGDATQEADEKYDVFNQETPQPGFGSIVLFGIVSVGKTFSNVIFAFFISIIKLPLVVLGVPSTIYNLILTWLTVVVIIAAWLVYKFGG